MTFDSTGAYLACGAVDGTVAVFQDGAPLKTFHQQDGQISVLRFVPKSVTLLAGSQNGDIVMYCLKKKNPVATFRDHLSYVNDITFLVAEDGSSAGFVSCSRDSYICFWSLDLKKSDLKEAKKSGTLLTRNPFKRIILFESVLSVGIITHGLANKGNSPWVLFLATESGVLKLIDPSSEKTLLARKVTYGQGDELRCATISKETNEILVLGSSGSLCFYSVNLELRHQLLGNIDGAYQMLYYKDSDTIDLSGISDVIGGTDSTETSKSTDATTNESSVTNEKKTKISKNERKQAKNTAKDLVNKECDSSSVSENISAVPDDEFQRRDWMHSLRWLKRQIAKGIDVIFILCGDDAIRMLALDGCGTCITLGLLDENHRHQDTVLSLAYSHSGNILVSGSKDEHVFIWDLRTLTVVTKVKLDGLNVACVAIPSVITSSSTQLKLIATGDNVMKSFDIPLWWLSQGRNGSTSASVCNNEIVVISTSAASAVRHRKPINAIAFSPNKKLIASAGSDKIVVIYATDNLIVKGECHGHRRSVISVAFTAIAKTVVSSSVDMTIKIWNLNDFTCIKTLQGHTKAVMKVLLLPNDLQLMSVGMDGLLKIWNIKTSDCIFTADNHADKVWNADIIGEKMLSISGNGVLISWDDVSAEVESKKLMEERDEELKRTQVESLDADGKYSEALCLALELRKPHMASKILKRRCTTQLFRVEKDHEIEGDLFQSWVKGMKKSTDIKRMLTVAFDFIQLWISKGSTSWMANCLLSELLKQFKPCELFVVEGMSNRIESLLAYQASHLTRFINLSEKSHLLDVLLGYNKASQPEPSSHALTYDVLYN
eukprot:XP_001610205.1 WD domain, G-beta repeat containing protein [Babesia bovis T2Bo]